MIGRIIPNFYIVLIWSMACQSSPLPSGEGSIEEEVTEATLSDEPFTSPPPKIEETAFFKALDQGVTNMNLPLNRLTTGISKTTTLLDSMESNLLNVKGKLNLLTNTGQAEETLDDAFDLTLNMRSALLDAETELTKATVVLGNKIDKVKIYLTGWVDATPNSAKKFLLQAQLQETEDLFTTIHSISARIDKPYGSILRWINQVLSQFQNFKQTAGDDIENLIKEEKLKKLDLEQALGIADVVATAINGAILNTVKDVSGVKDVERDCGNFCTILEDLMKNITGTAKKIQYAKTVAAVQVLEDGLKAINTEVPAVLRDAENIQRETSESRKKLEVMMAALREWNGNTLRAKEELDQADMEIFSSLPQLKNAISSKLQTAQDSIK